MIGEDQIGLLLQSPHEVAARSHTLALKNQATTLQLMLQPCSIRRIVFNNYNSKLFPQGFHLLAPKLRRHFMVGIKPAQMFFRGSCSHHFSCLSTVACSRVAFATGKNR